MALLLAPSDLGLKITLWKVLNVINNMNNLTKYVMTGKKKTLRSIIMVDMCFREFSCSGGGSK